MLPRLAVTLPENWCRKGSYSNYFYYLGEHFACYAVTDITELGLPDGLLLPGGGDIHPSHYGSDAVDKCIKLDEKRDEVELYALRLAFEKRLPVLGICRGAQVMNVALGGTLHTDLKERTPAHQPPEGDAFHSITFLRTGLGFEEGRTRQVNSSHHQAVETPGEGVVTMAVSPDGVVEAFDVTGQLAIGVQWHPERHREGDGALALSSVRVRETLRRYFF